MPVITDGQDVAEYQPSPVLGRRKGSTAGLAGVDPLTAHILQRTGTEATLNSTSALGSMEGVSFPGIGSARRSSELAKRGDVSLGGLPKEKKLVHQFSVHMHTTSSKG